MEEMLLWFAFKNVPKDWVNSVIVPVPKKGDFHLCDNWRGISLLSVPGKVFSRIIVNRIIDNYESILDETRRGYRKQRGTIFTARQIQEKAREQVCNLYVCFFDLKKAYDSVSIQICLMAGLYSFVMVCLQKWSTLYTIYIPTWKLLFASKGTLSDPFKVDTGLK